MHYKDLQNHSSSHSDCHTVKVHHNHRLLHCEAASCESVRSSRSRSVSQFVMQSLTVVTHSSQPPSPTVHPPTTHRQFVRSFVVRSLTHSHSQSLTNSASFIHSLLIIHCHSLTQGDCVGVGDERRRRRFVRRNNERRTTTNDGDEKTNDE